MARGICAFFLGCASLWASAAVAEEQWSLQDGVVRFHFFSDALDQLQVTIGTGASKAASLGSVEVLIDERRPLALTTHGSRLGQLSSDRVYAEDGLQIRRGTASVNVREFAVISDPQGANAGPVLLLSGVRASVDAETDSAAVPVDAVMISRELAAQLGQPLLENHIIGRAVLSGRAEWTGGDAPAEVRNVAPVQRGQATAGVDPGPDVKFCELYGLQQFGRLGDIVGLALHTTSWNQGTADLRWFGTPQEQHPFIVMNAYRQKDDRFEQIGQSWIKHGFYALSDEQCLTDCTYQPGHGEGDWLGVGCTDTYTASLNATQSVLGPRQEVNPWTGIWEYTGSHINLGGGHNAISHRLQIHDADLNPPQNVGASYYVEGYYVHLDDINVMNSASWKPFTIASGTPGVGNWTFSMTGFNTRPNDGFAVDAWTGATQTVLAQQVPVQEFVSPDGRCILSAKVTDLGGGEWHYEYALLNIDMDRKVKSFTIPIDLAANVQNIGFHAPESHNEKYNNNPWPGVVSTVCPASDRCVTWNTTDPPIPPDTNYGNPLRWGTLYNFRFDADMPPQESQVAGAGAANSEVTLGLYEPGSPTTVSGMTIGPMITGPIPAASAWTLACLALLVLIAGSIAVGRRKVASRS